MITNQGRNQREIDHQEQQAAPAAAAYYVTAKELAGRIGTEVPEELVSLKNLIYSSPATLSYHSPGAEGYGVKRASLAVPGSVLLLVAPACCGRNTAALSSPEYRDRCFYLLQDETDIVTGRHLSRISDAVREICGSTETPPSVVIICTTCVDALLGTDMERVCRKASEAAGVPVIPSTMYALTREGKEPPMVSVQRSIYSLLEKRTRRADAVNLIGEFASLAEETEIRTLLSKHGIRTLRELGSCRTYEEFLAMSEANFNLVINPEALPAAEDMHRRLGIPYLTFRRLYQPDKIRKQYELLGSALGIRFDITEEEARAEAAVDALITKHPKVSLAVGEWMNGSPFETAWAFVRFGWNVSAIYGTVTEEDRVYIEHLAEHSPETRIYSNLSPTMYHYACGEVHADVTIGQDAAYYHPESRHVLWNEEHKPLGFRGLEGLAKVLSEALETEVRA